MNERNTRRRARTGSFEPRTYADGTTRYFVRLRLSDGTKSPHLDVPAEIVDEAAASEWMAKQQASEDRDHMIFDAIVQERRRKAAAHAKPSSGELANDWFARYVAGKECGEGHRRTSKAQWGKWIAPHLEGIAIADLTRDKLEDIRDALDRAIDAKHLRSAANIWGIVTAAMKAASAAKDRTLRVHAMPLHFGILPPKGGSERTRPWVYPREWQNLAVCGAVPAEVRRMYASRFTPVSAPASSARSRGKTSTSTLASFTSRRPSTPRPRRRRPRKPRKASARFPFTRTGSPYSTP